MKRNHGILAALLLAALSPELAIAQTDGEGNRQMHRYAVVPNPGTGGGYVVTAAWTVDVVTPASVPLDFGTEVTLCVDGIPVQTLTVPVTIEPGAGTGCGDGPPCTGTCGTATVDGASVSLVCYEDGDGGGTSTCDCGVWIDSTFDPVSLAAGQEVKVQLAKSTGARPDTDSGDDGQGEPWERPIGWAREPVSMGFLEISPGVFDVRVPIQIEWDGLPGLLNLDTEAELRINGVTVSTQSVSARAEQDVSSGCAGPGCGGACGSLGGEPSFCDPLLWFDCACGGDAFVTFPAEPLSPGDEIMVLLRPAPGALPELPGLDEDDELVLTCCAPVAVEETVGASAVRLDQNRPNPFNPRTTITFELARTGRTRLEIFDAGGRLVRTVLNRTLDAGEWTATWNGKTDGWSDAPTGTYFYKLTTPGGTEMRRMTLLR